MKNILVKGMMSLLTVGMLAGCSKDYLDLAPVTTVSSATVQTTQDGAQQALYGICSSMFTMWDEDLVMSYGFPVGEPSIQTVYGDILGQDYYSYFWNYFWGGNMMWDPNSMPNAWIPLLGWDYCYNLINQANTILDGIDTIEGDQARLQFIKAQALTFRAHAYTRLIQLYAPRWEDSQNGERYCCVIRTTSSVADVPLAKMNDVVKLIYDDLELAEKIYSECGVNRTNGWEPNLNVAQAIHARCAMVIHDYETAEKMAHAARQGYPIMSADEYKAGFCTPNKEWIWFAYNQAENGYDTWDMLYGCNGAYPLQTGWGAGVINYELYRQFQPGDIRSDLFFTPDKLVGNRVRASAFWNRNWIDPMTMNLNGKNSLMQAQIKAFNKKSYPTDTSIDWPAPYVDSTQTEEEGVIMFGAQYKFWGKNIMGAGDYCVIRGAEMLLTEAEAAYHNGNETIAKANLNELCAERIPNYNCTLSGQALYEEIKLQRRFELWGEGFNFFDLKRWVMPMDRNPWVEGDVNSNNIPAQYELHKPATDRGWRFAVPNSESRYNTLIDRTLVDY